MGNIRAAPGFGRIQAIGWMTLCQILRSSANIGTHRVDYSPLICFSQAWVDREA
jgi:hypothetical protein